jgi:hypothetical protein
MYYVMMLLGHETLCGTSDLRRLFGIDGGDFEPSK